MGKPILCLDFDGVCHSYTTKWQGASIIPDPPVEGLFQFLLNADQFFEINIFSTRSHQEDGVDAMRQWFMVHCPDNYDVGQVLRKLKFPMEKPPAYVGIDDRVITFEGTWPDIKFLRDFKPWNKREATTLTVGFHVDLRPSGELHRVQLVKDGVTIGLTLEQAKSLVSELSARLQ